MSTKKAPTKPSEKYWVVEPDPEPTVLMADFESHTDAIEWAKKYVNDELLDIDIMVFAVVPLTVVRRQAIAYEV